MKVTSKGVGFEPVILTIQSVEEFNVLKHCIADTLDSSRGYRDGISNSETETETIKGEFYIQLDNESIRQRKKGVKNI